MLEIDCYLGGGHMRIDKAKNKEISISHCQKFVNEYYKTGCTQAQIEEALLHLNMEISEGEDKAVITVKVPRVLIEPSHLGKGYIASYKCPSCSKKVRKLYYLYLHIACRTCHQLTYKRQTRRKAEINKLVINNDLRESYFNSWNTSRIRKAMEAEWAREAIMEEGYKKGQGIVAKLKNS